MANNMVAPQSSSESETLPLFRALKIDKLYGKLLTDFAAKYGNDFLLPDNMGEIYLNTAYSMFGRFLEWLLKTPAKQLVTFEKEHLEDWLEVLKSFKFGDGQWKLALLTNIENTKTLMTKVNRLVGYIQQSNNEYQDAVKEVKAVEDRKSIGQAKYSKDVAERNEARDLLEAPLRYL